MFYFWYFYEKFCFFKISISDCSLLGYRITTDIHIHWFLCFILIWEVWMMCVKIPSLIAVNIQMPRRWFSTFAWTIKDFLFIFCFQQLEYVVPMYLSVCLYVCVWIYCSLRFLHLWFYVCCYFQTIHTYFFFHTYYFFKYLFHLVLSLISFWNSNYVYVRTFGILL